MKILIAIYFPFAGKKCLKNNPYSPFLMEVRFLNNFKENSINRPLIQNLELHKHKMKLTNFIFTKQILRPGVGNILDPASQINKAE